MRAALLAAAGMLVLATGAQAAVQAPAELQSALPQVQPAGSTRLTFWGFEIYDASLWVQPGFRASAWRDAPFALELRYLRSFDGDDIAQRSLDEMRKASPLSDVQARSWLDQMKNAFPDVQKGDRLVGLYRPGAGAQFFYNGKPTAAVADPVFAQRFFGIWLGSQSSEPGMRDALLAPVAR